ncbi:hypothetical protein HMPREF1981_02911 [Bacteroides pyogenes F0041]|uniref:Uncharacterized protein n=1 Tax=Bacteroides pyogenes F0041 TaxID=1321819 RepID=U2CB33_9BACE|nr:hypothetical protein HMPREF1981_02911 [Bacteroides pyogenes F0041]GAE20753.1 hypothetical protein JCM10003_115 [Bacteroides pyogenes JCM 10003]
MIYAIQNVIHLFHQAGCLKSAARFFMEQNRELFFFESSLYCSSGILSASIVVARIKRKKIKLNN